MPLSYLLLSPDARSNDPSEYGSTTILGKHETHVLVDVLSHCFQGHAKEGHGAYLAATFSLKGVLRAVEYILSEPKNGVLFTSSSAGTRLNVLLLKVVARHALVVDNEAMRAPIDAEAAEHIPVSVHRVTRTRWTRRWWGSRVSWEEYADERMALFACLGVQNLMASAPFGNNNSADGVLDPYDAL